MTKRKTNPISLQRAAPRGGLSAAVVQRYGAPVEAPLGTLQIFEALYTFAFGARSIIGGSVAHLHMN